jgi:hypothetical protein
MTRAKLTAAQHAARHSRIAHLLRTTCRYCHAPAGEPCRSKSGTPIWEIAQMHNARLTPLPLAPNDPDKARVTDQLACRTSTFNSSSKGCRSLRRREN